MGKIGFTVVKKSKLTVGERWNMNTGLVEFRALYM